MQNFNDLTGMNFGRWTVIRLDNKRSNAMKSKWICRCRCGTIRSVLSASLLNHKSLSCGCYHKEIASKSSILHGMSKTSEYKIWSGIIKRCYNKKCKAYPNYGGRGIKISKDWRKSFENFYRDMGKRPKGQSIDRIDNNKGYCKENCRWATRKQQNNNTRTNYNITFNNNTHTLAEWSRILNINYSCLQQRLKKLYWTTEKAFLTPYRTRRN